MQFDDDSKQEDRLVSPKVFFTYIVLVGIPILCILVVLRVGSGLEAPISIGGPWKVTQDHILALTILVVSLQIWASRPSGYPPIRPPLGHPHQ